MRSQIERRNRIGVVGVAATRPVAHQRERLTVGRDGEVDDPRIAVPDKRRQAVRQRHVPDVVRHQIVFFPGCIETSSAAARCCSFSAPGRSRAGMYTTLCPSGITKTS